MFCLISYFLFSNNPYSLSSTSCELTWTCENSNFKFRDNFGIKKTCSRFEVPDWWFNVPAGTSMFRPVLQCVLEVPAGTSSPIQSAKYELEVPAGTSKLIKVPAGTLSFKQTFSTYFFVFIHLFKVVQLFMINTRYYSNLLNPFKIFELIYFN